MRKIKIVMLLMGLLLFSSEVFAENNVKDAVVYGSVTEGSEVRQSDIDKLLENWVSQKILTLVGTLYKTLNDNESYLSSESYIKLVKIQEKRGITIDDLTELWVPDKAITDIKNNTSLVQGLSIDINRKTLDEILEEVQAKNKAEWTWEEIQAKNKEAHVKNKEAHIRKEQLENILLWS